jgi:hypothetical protein
MENLIVFRHSNAKYDGCDIFEAMNPLLSFGSLTADIEQSVVVWIFVGRDGDKAREKKSF